MSSHLLPPRACGLFGVLGFFLASCAGVGSQEVVLDPGTSLDTATTTTTMSAAPPTTLLTAATTEVTGTTETTLGPVRAPIVLGFAGDTSFTRGLETRDPFGQVLDLLAAPDLMVVNLETAIADADVGRPPVQKQFLFRSPPESLDLLVAAGVDVVALANNHTQDYGFDALSQTLAEIDSRDLDRVGAGLNQEQAYQPLIVEVGEWRIGLVSMSRVPCDWSASGDNVRPEVAWACPAFQDLADELVRRAVAESDFAVVMVHGGKEGVLCPSDFMVELENRWAELGVDLIVDGHPHVVQGITSIEVPSQNPQDRQTMVIHSTGNFAFPSAQGITANTAIFEITISEHVTSDGVTERAGASGGPYEIQQSLRVVPLRSDGGIVRLPTVIQHEAILEQINKVSEGWRLDSDGRAGQDPEHHGSC